MSYSGHLLVENRNGLIVEAMAWEANGTAEREAALVMLEQIPGDERVTVGGDKGYDTRDFVKECRHMKVTPHVAQNDNRLGAVPWMNVRRGMRATASVSGNGSVSRNASAG